MAGAGSLGAAHPAWAVVADRELRDTWLGGRALALALSYAVLLSATTYLVAVNEELNFLEQRESTGLTLQIAVALGSLLALLAAADAVSGERERGTLESLLLTPAPRRDLVIGKGIAAFSLWIAAYVVSLPYVWYLGRDVEVLWTATVAGFVVGSVLSLFLVAVGLLLSMLAQSNKMSLSVGLFALLAFYAPTQMPSAAQQGWAGDLLLRIDPFTAALRFLDRVVHLGRDAGSELGWLAGPFLAAVLAVVAVLAVAPRLALLTGDRS